MQMAQQLPSRAFTLWHHIPRFIIQASPVLASSGAAVRQISMISGSGSLNQTEVDRSFLDANWRRFEQDYGVPHGQQAELARLAALFMFSENTVGANSEALQCLRKGAGADWRACTHYASFALMISSIEQNAGRCVSLQAYLVGNRGQKYLEECWRAQGVEEGVGFVSIQSMELIMTL